MVAIPPTTSAPEQGNGGRQKAASFGAAFLFFSIGRIGIEQAFLMAFLARHDALVVLACRSIAEWNKVLLHHFVITCYTQLAIPSGACCLW